MSKATSPSTFSTAIVAAALVFSIGGTGAGLAQSMPDTENGRYALSPVADGVLRLDTRTGAVSTCTNGGAGWACYAVPDERTALDAEIGRLQADNERLKAELAAREPVVSGKIDEALPKETLPEEILPKETLPKSDSLKKPEPKVAEGERKIEIPLPSDRDMDRVFSFLERAWKRLIEMAIRVQKDVSGKI
ncbi:hypothetical protein KMZ93_03625 [Bradyrhizobium sediminis]|uniref:Uncharacterized protein n=1 Tax=Bradyrhizobium sediminis TaxID=2840469 RepID=A0A975NZ05_9BRAD|nr:hypothetical protein [Bradyrhizobium sediminis]QWG24032.1 hypothetical protein KMZ93_03625 [Bradyrhizobium sediminis]